MAPSAHPPIHLSRLAEVEAVALRRVGRHEGLHPSFVDAMQNTFERYLALSDPAGRGLDAIQPACAITTARALPDELALVTSDVRLTAVAPLGDLRVINPMYPPRPERRG